MTARQLRELRVKFAEAKFSVFRMQDLAYFLSEKQGREVDRRLLSIRDDLEALDRWLSSNLHGWD